MPALRGFLWLLGFLLTGEILVTLTGLPVSAGVVGMLLLTAWLLLHGGGFDDIAAAAQPLIAMLAMLIMPGVVGVFFLVDELAGQWTAILAALVGGTLLSVLTTLWLMRRLMAKRHGDPRDPGHD
ncbi:CidA/LrgA family protein [Halomonas sp. LR5S13]|uniref:CidA/LrgA family protein n=1 Tax=Halomonas rhizosphaerae TaxID=3043296 RepID=UPI0024A9C093|nr:CidA/LrgA family protein [Halomonas rhizosphaerae]MDI5919538.1 CidA/LrgA family protein [Halomonas rhizosphaerae]